MDTKPQELKRTDKPTLDKKVYINAIMRSYQASHDKKSVWGWFLYDWLDERGAIQIDPKEFAEAFKASNNNIDAAKTKVMNMLIQTERVTFEQVKALL